MDVAAPSLRSASKVPLRSGDQNSRPARPFGKTTGRHAQSHTDNSARSDAPNRIIRFARLNETTAARRKSRPTLRATRKPPLIGGYQNRCVARPCATPGRRVQPKNNNFAPPYAPKRKRRLARLNTTGAARRKSRPLSSGAHQTAASRDHSNPRAPRAVKKPTNSRPTMRQNLNRRCSVDVSAPSLR